MKPWNRGEAGLLFGRPAVGSRSVLSKVHIPGTALRTYMLLLSLFPPHFFYAFACSRLSSIVRCGRGLLPPRIQRCTCKPTVRTLAREDRVYGARGKVGFTRILWFGHLRCFMDKERSLRKRPGLLRLYCELQTVTYDKAKTGLQPQNNCDVHSKSPGHCRNTQSRNHSGISGMDESWLTHVQTFNASDQRGKHPAFHLECHLCNANGHDIFPIDNKTRSSPWRENESFFPRKSYLPNYKLVIFARQAVFHDFSGTSPSHTL